MIDLKLGSRLQCTNWPSLPKGQDVERAHDLNLDTSQETQWFGYFYGVPFCSVLSSSSLFPSSKNPVCIMI